MSELQTADIVFFRGKSWISRQIRNFSRTGGEARTKANHVGIVVAPGTERTAIVVEAVSTVKIHALGAAHLDTNEDVAVARPINLSTDKRGYIALEAARFINRKYGYIKILLHAMDRVLGGRYFFRRLGRLKRYPICSYLVAQSFATIGKDFGVSVGHAQPDDIWDFVESNPDKYTVVRDFRPI